MIANAVVKPPTVLWWSASVFSSLIRIFIRRKHNIVMCFSNWPLAGALDFARTHGKWWSRVFLNIDRGQLCSQSTWLTVHLIGKRIHIRLAKANQRKATARAPPKQRKKQARRQLCLFATAKSTGAFCHALAVFCRFCASKILNTHLDHLLTSRVAAN